MKSSRRMLRCFSLSKVHHTLEKRIYFIIVNLIDYIFFKIQLFMYSTIWQNSNTSSFIDVKNSNIISFISFDLSSFSLCLVISSFYLSRCLKYLLIRNWRLDFNILSHFAMKSMLLFSSSYKRFMIKKLLANLLKLLDLVTLSFLPQMHFDNLLRIQYPQCCLASRCVLYQYSHLNF